MKFKGRILTESDKRRYKFYNAHKTQNRLKLLIAAIPETKYQIRGYKRLMRNTRDQLTKTTSWGNLEILYRTMSTYHRYIRYYTEVLDWERACLSDMWKKHKSDIDKK